MPTLPARAVVWGLAATFGVATSTPADACWFKCGQQRKVSYAAPWPPPCNDPFKTYLCCNPDNNKLELPSERARLEGWSCECTDRPVDEKCSYLSWDPALQGWRPARPGDNPAFIRASAIKSPQPVSPGAGK